MELVYNQRIYDLFWHYINERQKIWYKRFILNEVAPWTKDEVLQSVHFTNVYPQLDRGHQFLINNVVPNYTIRNQIFRAMVYRAFNNIDSFKLIDRYVNLNKFDADIIYTILQRRKENGNKVFTGAYMITGTRWANSPDKLVNYCYGLLPRMKDELNTKYDDIIGAETLEDVFNIMITMSGMGKFNSYIFATDLAYTNIKPYSLDKWVNAGPGAVKALKLIYPEAKRDWNDYIRVLCDKQRENLKPDFPYYNNQKLTLDCIEWSLCEFQKYYAKLTKEYRAKARQFTPRKDNPYE